MKIALASDVHNEFGKLTIKNTENAEVLILSCDIIVAASLFPKDEVIPGANPKSTVDRANTRSNNFHAFFQEACQEFPHVVYIMGNHEHYHGDFAKSYKILCEHLGYLDNLHILNHDMVNFGDVTFIGGTLWTDFNNEDPVTLVSIQNMMNDFQIVKNSNAPIFNPYGKASDFSPYHALDEHKHMLQFIKDVVDDRPDSKFVVVGHHAPSKNSTKPQYEKDVLMNGGYSSKLDEFILDRPQIKVWTHGHTHHEFDYMIGETRILCNPRGYIGYEAQADNFKLKYFEV